MVVVAVVQLPALPFLLVCEKSVCGGLALALAPGLVGDEAGMGSGSGAEITGVLLGMLGGWSGESAPSVLSREVRGVPAVIMVSTDWLRDVRQDEAAEWRRWTMEGPGRRWAFVR